MKPYYQDDLVTLYHGDCREVLPCVRGDLVVTDPPYGMGKAEWDASIVPVGEWLPLAMAIGPVALFCGVKGLFDYPKPDWIGAWVRLGSTQRNGALKGFNNWEPIVFYGLESLSNDVISAANYSQVDGHPTPKPVNVIAALLARMPDGIVVDPFCGSGTTLVTSKRDGRKAIGIEIEERYCEIAANRCRQGSLSALFQP